MKTLASTLTATLLLATSTLLAAQSSTPPVGSYGFDWLRPKRAKCERVTEEMIKRFSHCAHGEQFSFGHSVPAHACRVNKRSEYIVLPNKKQCTEILETMKSHGE